MRYMLMNYVDETGWPALTKAEQEAGIAAYAAYTRALTAAGALKGAGRLQPTATAKTVRLRGGKPLVLDGPYAESKEVFGGYFLIEAPDGAAALAWAEQCPAVGHGVVELRPMWDAM
jgi:hypothetical protein